MNEAHDRSDARGNLLAVHREQIIGNFTHRRKSTTQKMKKFKNKKIGFLINKLGKRKF